MSGLPPQSDKGVFSVSSSVVIDVPVATIWETLLDFPSYPEWNSFVRSQTAEDIATSDAQADQSVSEGRFFLLKTHIPPTMQKVSRPQTTRVQVTHVDNENHRVAWCFAGKYIPISLLHSERWQALTVIEEGKTKYETIEVFNGLLAYFVKWFVGAGLVCSFNAMAEDLKKRCETGPVII